MMPWPRRPLAERLWERVDVSGMACWPWMGATHRNGYGVISDSSGRQLLTHRVAWNLTTGQTLTPQDMVLHSCDNPRCCRPDHLRKGTHAENMADRQARGRQLRWGRHHQAKLTASDVRTIRTRVAQGERQVAIARALGLSRSAINHIVRERTWRLLSETVVNHLDILLA